jgi:hypothetical protein
MGMNNKSAIGTLIERSSRCESDRWWTYERVSTIAAPSTPEWRIGARPSKLGCK